MLSLVHVLEWRAAVHPESVALTDDRDADLIRAGALPLAVNWRLAAPEITALLRLAGTSAVIADADCAALTRQAVTALGRPVPARPMARLQPSEPAIIVHTSGTIVDRLTDVVITGGETLVSWARERLAGFKCPTGVTVVAELPRNATGKVLRAALREPFWAGRDRRVS